MGLTLSAMSSALVQGDSTDPEGLLETESEAVLTRGRLKIGIIVGGALLVGAALVFAVAPTSIRTSSDMQHSVVSLDVDIDYISGYVTVNGKCPKGQEITDSEECKKAGIATGFKKHFRTRTAIGSYPVVPERTQDRKSAKRRSTKTQQVNGLRARASARAKRRSMSPR